MFSGVTRWSEFDFLLGWTSQNALQREGGIFTGIDCGDLTLQQNERRDVQSILGVSPVPILYVPALLAKASRENLHRRPQRGGAATTRRAGRVGAGEHLPIGMNRLTEGRKGEELQRNFSFRISPLLPSLTSVQIPFASFC
jgi:hypothetical protein